MSDEERAYKVALAGSLPDEQQNGWDSDEFAEKLDKNRAELRYAMVSYNVLHLREVTDSGKKIVTVRIRGIEPVEEAHQAHFVKTQMGTLRQARTGQAALIDEGGNVTEPDSDSGDRPDEWLAE